MSSATARILLIMLAAVLALSSGEMFLSKGMRQVGHAPRDWMGQAAAVLHNGWVWAGCALLVLHVGLYMAALRDADLSFILPLTAASYPLAAILAQLILHEKVDPIRWAGTILITVGVAVVGLGGAGSSR
jgi:drug/metabolite transporter (DMT)-like permease